MTKIVAIREDKLASSESNERLAASAMTFRKMLLISIEDEIAFVDKKLKELGVGEDHLKSMYRPIGLPIKAETPEEIAVCILAEIIAVQRGANVAALRNAT